MKNLLASTCLLIGLMAGEASAAADKCGTVTIASMSWASAELMAAVDQFILKHGYGCDASVVLGDTVPTLTSMAERGQPDVAPEGWAALIPPATQRNIDEGKLVVAGKAFAGGGVEGVYVPKFIVDQHPEIKTIADAVKRPDLFPDSQDPSKAAWHAGVQGWGGAIVLAQYYKAYGAKKAGFNLVDSGSAAAHDGSVVNAYTRGRGWIGYYWEPTSLLGKYEMVRLPSGTPYDAAEWARCNKVENCPDPKPNEWPFGDVNTIVTKAFAERAGAGGFEYLARRSWPNKVVNQMLAYMNDNQATGADAAREFLKKHEAVWTPWVMKEAVQAVKSAL